MTRLLLAALLLICGQAWAQNIPPPTQNVWITGNPNAPAVPSSPGPRTIIPLDVSSVTTGGTAVTALTAGHATAGGFISTNNAAGLCVDQHTTAGTATGTPSTTVCVAVNVPFYLVPTAAAVSVNSSGSGVALGGEGLN
jgi:hypothetical protein